MQSESVQTQDVPDNTHTYLGAYIKYEAKEHGCQAFWQFRYNSVIVRK